MYITHGGLIRPESAILNWCQCFATEFNIHVLHSCISTKRMYNCPFRLITGEFLSKKDISVASWCYFAVSLKFLLKKPSSCRWFGTQIRSWYRKAAEMHQPCKALRACGRKLLIVDFWWCVPRRRSFKKKSRKLMMKNIYHDNVYLIQWYTDRRM